MEMRVFLGGLLCIALLFFLVQRQEAQECSSIQLQVFTQRLNASRDAVLRQGIRSLQAIYAANNPGSSPLTLTPSFIGFYGALLNIYGLSTAEESFYNFMKALSYVTNSYYLACYGPADMQVSADMQSVASLFTETLTLLENNRSSDIPLIRENFGQILCIAENFSSTFVMAQLAAFFTAITPDTLQPIVGLGSSVQDISQIAIIGYTETLENGDLIPTNELPFACEFSSSLESSATNRINPLSLHHYRYPWHCDSGHFVWNKQQAGTEIKWGHYIIHNAHRM